MQEHPQLKDVHKYVELFQLEDWTNPSHLTNRKILKGPQSFDWRIRVLKIALSDS